MEPRIQYAKTRDGVNIAYAVFGDGPPIVDCSQIWGSLHLTQAGVLGHRDWITRLVDLGRSVAVFDARGTGSSERDVEDFSLSARVCDLEAVVARLGISRFPLTAQWQGTPVAVEFTVRHPDSVSHLILTNPFASGAAYYASIPAMGLVKAMRDMAQDQWEFFTQSLASAVTGFNDLREAQAVAAAFRSGMSPRAFSAWRDEAETIDITDRLPLVRVPTLVVRDESGPVWSASVTRTVAAGIPTARFVATVDLAAEVAKFVGARAPAPAVAAGTAVILFTDIVDSTALTERLGDDAFREASRTLDERCRTAIREAGGTPVEGKVLGDGVMAVFTSARQAIDAALRCQAATDGTGLELHVGVHAGDVIRDGNNVYGGAVNVAARIAGESAAGETLVSATVRDLARTSAGVAFEDRGEYALKGIEDAQRLYAVRAREAAAD